MMKSVDYSLKFLLRLSESESDSLRDPEPGVQMKLRSDQSDSLNQSESEQINGSVSRG